MRHESRILALSIGIALVSGLAEPAFAQPAPVGLRSLDRAVVKIITFYGVDFHVGRGRNTGVSRVFPSVRAAHGTGVLVSGDGLVVTARHVVEGGSFHLAYRAGSDEPLPVRVVAVHPDHDLAVLQIPGPTRDFISLREPRALQPGQRLFTSGYPVTMQERYPAAASGELSRSNNDGTLQVSIALNGGNSGGPVVDDSNGLVGIAVRAGDPQRGVQGIALVEPMSHVLEVRRLAQQALEGPGRAGPWAPTEAGAARLAATLLQLNPDGPMFDPARANQLLASSAAATTPETRALLVAAAWGQCLAALEHNSATDIQGLPAPAALIATQLRNLAVSEAMQLRQSAPFLRHQFSLILPIARTNGRLFVPQSRLVR